MLFFQLFHLLITLFSSNKMSRTRQTKPPKKPYANRKKVVISDTEDDQSSDEEYIVENLPLFMNTNLIEKLTSLGSDSDDDDDDIEIEVCRHVCVGCENRRAWRKMDKNWKDQGEFNAAILTQITKMNELLGELNKTLKHRNK